MLSEKNYIIKLFSTIVLILIFFYATLVFLKIEQIEISQIELIWTLGALIFLIISLYMLFTKNLTFRQHAIDFFEDDKKRTYRSEMDLNLALASVNMGTWWIDVKSNHTYISTSLAALYGITKYEGKNTDFMVNLIHPDDRTLFQLKLTEQLKTFNPIYHEFRILHSDGSTRWHYTRNAFTFDENGDPLFLHGVQGDRTDNKLQSDLLRDSEEKYRNLVSDAQDGILIVDEEGLITFGNQRIGTMFGYSHNEYINQPIELLVPEHLRATHVVQREKYLANPTQRPMGRMNLELNGQRKDGSEFAIDIGLSPSDSKKGKIVTAIIRDISERKRREKQLLFLASASRVLAESFESTNIIQKVAELTIHQIAEGCAVRLVDEDGTLHINLIIFRDPEKQKIIQQLSKLLKDKNSIPAEVKEVMRSKVVQINNNPREIRVLDLSTSEQSVAHINQYNSADIPLLIKGESIGVLSIISDKSKWHFNDSDIEFLKAIGTQVALSIENTRLYREAQNAIKLREDILAIVSHDLRNPLFLIQMAGEVLPKITDQSKILSFSEKILRSTNQMKRLIEDLMDFAKIQEGNLSIERTPEEPGAVIEMVYEIMKFQAEKKGLNFSMKVNPELPLKKFDKQRIAQALSNLVGNSIKFTNSGGTVQLSALKSGDDIKFSVTDTGQGISKEDLPKIFDRYWQSKKSKTASAGLGLSITKGIIEAHGSQIFVESQLGQGSTFYFLIP